MANVNVTLDAQGGLVDPSTVVVTVGGVYGSLPAPTKSGNSFGGWYTSSTRGALVEASTVVENENDHYLYARWIPDRVTVTFDVPQGVTVTPASKVVEKTFPYGWLPTPTRTGYVFVKWSSSSSGSDEITSESVVPVDNPPTRLYAIWRAETHVVHFDVNGGFLLQHPSWDGGADYGTQRTYTYGQPFGIMGPSEWRSGAIRLRHWLPRVVYPDGRYLLAWQMSWMKSGAAAFLGWFDDPVGGNEYKETDVCYLDHDMTLYAHWDYSLLAHDVTFDPCGGSVEGSTDPVSKKYVLQDGGISIFKFGRLPFARKRDCVFIGWYTVPDDRLVCSRNGSQYDDHYVDGWYVATAHGSVASAVKVSKDSYLPDEERTQVSNPPTHLQIVTISKDLNPVSLFARWKRYEVVLDHQGGASFDSKVMADYGEPLPTIDRDYDKYRYEFEPTIPSFGGHTFLGYYEYPGGRGKRYYKPVDGRCVPDEPWDKFGGGVIYACWDSVLPPIPASKTVTVTFSSSYALSFRSKVVKVGEPYGELPVIDNHRVHADDYYMRVETDDGFDYVDVWPGKICEVESDHTVYVGYDNTSYSLKLVLNGGTLVGANKTSYTPNFATDLRLPSATRQNFTFGGWYESPLFEGSARSSLSSSDWGDKVLYAKWVGVAYTLTFNPNGGSVAVGSKSLGYGECYGDMPTPTRTGMQFEGWFTSATGGSRVLPTDVFSGTAAMTVYAHWGVIPPDPGGGSANWGYVKYSVKLVLNGGRITDSGYVLKFTSGFSKPLPTESQVSKPGATFGGWYATADFTGDAVTSIPASATGSKTFFAKWV